jgi:hypothetical protein
VLCRNLKENPNVAGNMLKIQTERMQLQTLLSTAIVELEDCAHDTLNSTVRIYRETPNDLDTSIFFVLIFGSVPAQMT